MKAKSLVNKVIFFGGLLLVLMAFERTEAAELPEVELNCLALNLYHEARGEGVEGMIAVGHVTLNRVRSQRFPDTVCEVVHQPWQFTWLWDGSAQREPDMKSWMLARRIAAALLSADGGQIADPTRGATHYLNPHTATGGDWRHHMLQTAAIGRHLFYRRA